MRAWQILSGATPRLFVLTGAGASTDSGIPDYRDAQGAWKRKQPVRFQEFVTQVNTRKRYWARSMIGWPLVASAVPGSAHVGLAQLQQAGYVQALVTQNVDGLHQAAGSTGVVDLHGRIDRCICLECGDISARSQLQERLQTSNPDWLNLAAGVAPDGDADLDAIDTERFNVPDCRLCGGLLKPGVVFFGEAVPKKRVVAVFDSLEQSDAVLAVGSSLMVLSGYRFARMAACSNRPVAILNRGRTRADDIASLKLDRPCGPVLQALIKRLQV